MLNFFKEQKGGIIGGIVASAIFLYFIQPILEYSSHLLINISNIFGNAFSDRLYQQIAHLETQDNAFILVMVLFGMISGVLFSVGIVLMSANYRAHKKDGANEKEKPKAVKRNSKVLKHVLPILIFLLSIFPVISALSIFIQLSTISSFKQHIRIIAPYITNQEEEVIISQWSQIRSKSDYQFIYRKLEGIAIKNKVTLPDNKIYSLLSV